MSVMGVEGVAGVSGIRDVAGLSGLGGAEAVGGAAGAGFGSAIASALEGVQGLQSKSDGLAVQAATGDLTDVHDYMIASNEAKVATELTVAVRNKAVEAFNEIMRLTV
jgi:flagellar hook-basal body complex protein FliE